MDFAESTRLGQCVVEGLGHQSLTRELALDLEQIRSIRLFSHEALMDGEMLVLEVEDLVIVQIGEHWMH